MTNEDPMDLVVRGRLALSDGRLVNGDLGIRDGRIAAIAEPGALSAATVLDAGERLVLPGQVDVHVHTRSEPSEGVARATTAAAAGGVTTIVDMPYDAPEPITNSERLIEKAAEVDEAALVDVGLYATLPKTGGLDEIDALLDAGALAFKLSTFETHPIRFPRIPDDEIYLALSRLSQFGALTAFHPENNEIIARFSAMFAAGSDPFAHSKARPAIAETEAVSRVLEFARATSAPVHLCHLSTARSFQLVSRAGVDGADVSAETCVHYLVFDESEFERQGGRVRTNPPIRAQEEVEALWELLADGQIDIVSSDHVGWHKSSKQTDTLAAAKSGLPGLELSFPLLYTEGVYRRNLPLHRLLEVLCENPARRYGLWPQKGALSLGADADLFIYDPSRVWRVDESTLTSPVGWSPYHGREIVGRVDAVLLRGVVIVEHDQILQAPGIGAVLRGRWHTHAARHDVSASVIV
jgi:allantoinase